MSKAVTDVIETQDRYKVSLRMACYIIGINRIHQFHSNKKFKQF